MRPGLKPSVLWLPYRNRRQIIRQQQRRSSFSQTARIKPQGPFNFHHHPYMHVLKHKVRLNYNCLTHTIATYYVLYKVFIRHTITCLLYPVDSFRFKWHVRIKRFWVDGLKTGMPTQVTPLLHFGAALNVLDHGTKESVKRNDITRQKFLNKYVLHL